jgi:hypothetical protein
MEPKLNILTGQLQWSDDHDEITGDLVCQIMAANATDIVQKAVKVRMSVRREPTMNYVAHIVQTLR